MQTLTRLQQKKHAEQFDKLIRPHVQPMYHTAYKLTGSVPDAEDIVQDVLVKLYGRITELLAVDELRPWLMRVLYNHFVDHCRRQQRNPVSGYLANEFEESDPGMLSDAKVTGPQQQVEIDHQSREVNQALATLDQEKRALVVLHLMEGYSLDTLTGVFNVPLGTLKSRLFRAKAELKKRLLVEPFAESLRDRGKG